MEAVFTSDGNGVTISLHPGRLPKTRSTGTKDLALLVTAMRQATLGEEFTLVEEVRSLAQECDKYD